MGTVRTAAALAAALSVAGAPAAFATDSRPPRVAFATPSWSVVAGGVPGVGVEGTASDDASGVARVRVTYCGNGSMPITGDGPATCGSGPGGLSTIVTVDATLTCTSATRRTCTWVATAPLQPDRYLVFARATDAAGRSASAPDPILVVVV